MKEQSTEQLLTDINTLIKIVKRTFNVFETFNVSTNSLANTSCLLQRISQENKYLLQIIRKNKDIDTTTHQQVLQKMRSRIKEWLHHIKMKYQSTLAGKELKGLCQQLEVSLKTFQKFNKFIPFVTKLYTIINEQLRMFKIKLDLFRQREDAPSESLNSQLKRVHSLSNKPLNFHLKQIKMINFSNFYKLELDNHYIRSTILTQRGQMEWLHSQLERNKNTNRHVEEFNKQYFLYSQKQKNRNRSQFCPKIQNRQTIRVKTTVHEKLYHNFNMERSRKAEVQQKENIVDETPKATYKLNNLYVSGNQFNVYCENSQIREGKPNKYKKKESLILCKIFRDSLTTKHSSERSKQLIKFLH